MQLVGVLEVGGLAEVGDSEVDGAICVALAWMESCCAD